MTWTFEKVAGPYKGATGGIAWDGGYGIRAVDVSTDGGKTWEPATLGEQPRQSPEGCYVGADDKEGQQERVVPRFAKLRSLATPFEQR